MPPVAVGPEVDEFVAGLKIRGRAPVCYRCSDVSAWLWGNSAPGGRPPELPASAFDPANDQTMQLRRAGQVAKNAGDEVAEKKIRRKIAGRAKIRGTAGLLVANGLRGLAGAGCAGRRITAGDPSRS